MKIMLDIELLRKRMNESYKRQILSQPEKKCHLCNWFLKHEWKQKKVEQLEAEVKQLKRTLTRTLNRRLKPRTDTYSLQHNR